MCIAKLRYQSAVALYAVTHPVSQPELVTLKIETKKIDYIKLGLVILTKDLYCGMLVGKRHKARAVPEQKVINDNLQASMNRCLEFS